MAAKRLNTTHPNNPFDPRCQRFASEIAEYDTAVRADRESPHWQPSGSDRIRYVIANEGTYNPQNGHFLCDECYIKAGQPSAPGGWKCP